jgi:hypothetical protein
MVTAEFAAKRLLLETPWETLTHAYGSAAATPDALLDLVSDNAAERQQAVTHLWTAIVHQGSLYTATPAVARFLAALLPNEWLSQTTSSMYGDDLYPPTSTRAAILHFLAEIADAAGDNDDVSAQVAAVAAELLAAVSPWVGDADPDVHDNAVCAAVRLAPLTDAASPSERLLTHARDPLSDPLSRAISVLGIGQLGQDTLSFLDDEAEPVRVCAALANARRGNPLAQRVLINAVETFPAANWLGRRGYFLLRERPLQNAVISAVAETTADFDTIALAATRAARWATGNTRLQPLLEIAFPAWAGPLPPLDHNRRAFLHALAANDAIWNAAIFDTLEDALRERALPSSRAALTAFLTASVPPAV